MFFTFNCSEINLPQIFDNNPAIQCWPFIYTRGGGYWFYVVCDSIYNDADIENSSKNFFANTVLDVKGLMENPTVTLSEVYISAPSYMNGGNSWRMLLLTEVQLGVEIISGVSQNAYIYITASGEEFIDSVSGKKGDINNVKTILKF